MAEGEFQLKQETLKATIEQYEQLTKQLTLYKEEQQTILDSVHHWDSETSKNFRESYSGMLGGRYAGLQEKCQRITEILNTALEETNRLLNRRDYFPQLLRIFSAITAIRPAIGIPDLMGYFPTREAGGILKLNESLRNEVEEECDRMLELMGEERRKTEEIRTMVSEVGLSDWNLDAELEELEQSILAQRGIEDFKDSFVAYCEGVKELDTFLAEEFSKITEEYGEPLDAAGYKAVRDNTLDAVTKTRVIGMGNFMTKRAFEDIPLSPENKEYVERLRNGNFNITEGKRQTITAMATILLSMGYEVEFVAGVVANILYEGQVGLFENSNYKTNPDAKPQYLIYMDAYHKYREKFSDRNIMDVGIDETRLLLTNVNLSGKKGKFGLGGVQWTELDRVDGLIGCYEKICGSSNYPTFDQCIRAEGLWLVTELEEKPEYKAIYTDWENASAASNAEEKARSAGITFCKRYERPRTDTSKERGDLAVKVIREMTKQGDY